jgi:hypothetical protein
MFAGRNRPPRTALGLSAKRATMRWLASMPTWDDALARRQVLLEEIARCADAIAAIDKTLPTLKSQALEADLLQAEPIL